MENSDILGRPALRNQAADREYLTEWEVDLLMEAPRQNRWGYRDATAMLGAHRHGRRASEFVALRWHDIEWTTGRLHIRQGKGGTDSAHPISVDESQTSRRLQQQAPKWHEIELDSASLASSKVDDGYPPLSAALAISLRTASDTTICTGTTPVSIKPATRSPPCSMMVTVRAIRLGRKT